MGGGGRVLAQQPHPLVVDHLVVPGRFREEPLQPLDLAMLGTADRLGTGQPGQGLVAIPRQQQALQVVAKAAALGQAREQGVEPLGVVLQRAGCRGARTAGSSGRLAPGGGHDHGQDRGSLPQPQQTTVSRVLGVGLIGWARLPGGRGSVPCQLSLAALRHNEERDRLQARRLRAAELFAPGRPGRGRPPARRLRPGRQRLAAAGRQGGTEACAAAGPAAPAQAVGRPARQGRAGPAGGRQPPTGSDRAVDLGADRAGDRAASPGCASSGHVWRCCAIGWAGVCSGPSAGPPNATRRRSTAGSRSGRGSANAQRADGLLVFFDESARSA